MQLVRALLVAGLLLGAGCILKEDPSSSRPISPRPTDDDDDLITKSTPATPAASPSPTSGERVVPVVKISSSFDRRYANGTQWAPGYPGYHGCGDSFSIDSTRREVVVLHYPGTEPRPEETQSKEAQAALSLLSRDVGAYHRNNELRLPPSVPNTTELSMGNVNPYVVTIEIERGRTRVNDTELVPGASASFAHDYRWRRSDGEVLDVRETLDIQYLGDWVEPFRIAEGHMCI